MLLIVYFIMYFIASIAIGWIVGTFGYDRGWSLLKTMLIAMLASTLFNVAVMAVRHL